MFDLVTIAEATNDFSENNKLGEGGFGPVYMVIILIYLCSDETYIKSILLTQNDHYVVGKDIKIVILILCLEQSIVIQSLYDVREFLAHH